MATMKVSMDADDAKAAQAFIRLVNKQKQVATGARQLTQETRRGATAFGQMGSGAVQTLGGIAAGLVSVQQGIRLATEEWRSFHQAIEDAGAAQQKVMGDLLRESVGAGDPIGKVKGTMEQIMRERLGTSQQALGVYGAVRGEGRELETGFIQDITYEAARTAEVGMDPKLVGGLAAQLAEGSLKGHTPEESVNAAASIIQNLGNDASRMISDKSQLTRAQLLEAGVSPEKTLALQMSSFASGSRGTELARIADLANQTPEEILKGVNVRPGMAPTPEQARLQRLADMSPGERVDFLLSDSRDTEVQAIMSHYDWAQEKVRGGLSGDWVDDTMAGLAKDDPEYRRYIAERRSNIGTENADYFASEETKGVAHRGKVYRNYLEQQRKDHRITWTGEHVLGFAAQEMDWLESSDSRLARGLRAHGEFAGSVMQKGYDLLRPETGMPARTEAVEAPMTTPEGIKNIPGISGGAYASQALHAAGDAVAALSSPATGAVAITPQE